MTIWIAPCYVAGRVDRFWQEVDSAKRVSFEQENYDERRFKYPRLVVEI